MLDIILTSMDHKLLDITSNFLMNKFLENGYMIRGPIMMPSKKKKWTFLASPQAHKNARVQLELNYSKRIIRIINEDLASNSVPSILSSCDIREEIAIMIR